MNEVDRPKREFKGHYSMELYCPVCGHPVTDVKAIIIEALKDGGSLTNKQLMDYLGQRRPQSQRRLKDKVYNATSYFKRGGIITSEKINKGAQLFTLKPKFLKIFNDESI